jgi:hypothetical protein
MIPLWVLSLFMSLASCVLAYNDNEDAFGACCTCFGVVVALG